MHLEEKLLAAAAVVVAVCMHILRHLFLFEPWIWQNLVFLHEDHNSTDRLQCLKFNY